MRRPSPVPFAWHAARADCMADDIATGQLAGQMIVQENAAFWRIPWVVVVFTKMVPTLLLTVARERRSDVTVIAQRS